MDAKISEWNLEEYIDQLKVSPPRILINYKVTLQKGKLSHFTVEKSDPSPLNQMIKANITGDETKRQQHVPPDTVPWEKPSTTALVLLPRAYDLNAITKKHQTNPKEGSLYNVSGLHYEKMSRSWMQRDTQ